MIPWEPTDCETHEYRNPDGETIRFRTLRGTAGRMMTPVVVTTLPAPGRGGARFVGALHAERVVTLPVVAPGPFDGRPDYRTWPRILDPSLGQGTLTVVQGDWPGRQLVCVYEAGLEAMTEDDPTRNPAALMFRAASPYWVDADETIVDVGGAGDVYVWFPFAGSFAEFPLILGRSNTFASFEVVNTGDVEGWPVVTVVGPATEVEVTNNTTGASWHVTGEIADESTLVVDTRPGRKLVRVDGVNAYPRLTDDSNLWPLIRGTNVVTLTAVGIAAETMVRFAWRNSWLAA